MKPSRTRPLPRYRGGQGGFVLVIVLALLVVLTLLATAVAASGSRAVSAAQAEMDRFQGELDMRSTRETALFMLATQRRNIGGLTRTPGAPVTQVAIDGDDGTLALPRGDEIRLDSTPYRGVGQSNFALQDDRGLINPNWAVPSLSQALYAARGVEPGRWNDMDALRLDYQDPDDLERLGGAERDRYISAGLPPPPNRAVTSPLEFRRILGWNQMLAGLDDGQLLRILSPRRGGTVNLNTAPVEVLALLPGMTRPEAERLAALRRHSPLISLHTLPETFPIAPFMLEAVSLFPTNSGNLILWDRRFGGRKLVHWRLTPFAIGGPPWQIDYEVILPRDNQSDDSVAEATEAPLLATEGPTGEGS